ncbi:hypothetical protein LTR85_009535 [Meristemomyces frigidus]|nr:hypothetical protein LTR85_009535 [Meristemomyces frigidus]
MNFQEWNEEMARRFDTVDVQNARVLKRGGDEVVVFSDRRLRVRRTTEEWAKPFAQVVMTDREEGVITEMRPFDWEVKGLNEVLEKQ